jgi:glutaconate CoA-transferase subunit A
MRESKLIPLKKLSSIVQSGSVIGIGGVSLYRRPMALIREIIREGITDLEIISFTSGIELDLLAAAKYVKRVRTCYGGLEVLGLAPNFHRAAENGYIRVIEETEASIVCGLKASSSGLSFLPFHGCWETDILKVRPDVKAVDCPYTGKKYLAWPGLNVDVAIIHCQAADETGNAVINSQYGVDRLLAWAAGTVIISAEEIVSTKDIISQKAAILAPKVKAVVNIPFGAHPTSCYPLYRTDFPMIIKYLQCFEDGESDNCYKNFILEDEGEYYMRFIAGRKKELSFGVK